VLNNLRGDQPGKLGLTYSDLAGVNPRLVCAHLSAYGRDNERKGWPGYDYLMQAEAGYLHVTGEPGTPPARMGLSIVDFMTGITAALAIVSALLGVARDGRGGDIDVSLFDVALHQLSYPGTWYPQRGSRDRQAAAQLPPFGDAGPALPDTRRLDLHHVHDGEILAQPAGRDRAVRTWPQIHASRRLPRAASTGTS